LPALFEAAVHVLEEAGASVVDVELPNFDATVGAVNITSRAEALAYHMLDMRQRRQLYGEYMADFIELGASVMGYDYVQAQRLRMVAKRDVASLMSNLDAIAMPTSGAAALPLEGLTSDSMFTAPTSRASGT